MTCYYGSVFNGSCNNYFVTTAAPESILEILEILEIQEIQAILEILEILEILWKSKIIIISIIYFDYFRIIVVKRYLSGYRTLIIALSPTL